MIDDLAWALVCIALVGALIGSIAFRSGRSARVRRPGLRSYRRTELPAYLRNLWIVMPIMSGGFFPLGIELFVVLRLPIAVGVPRWLGDLIVYGSIAYALLLFGSVLILTYRPPKWLIPKWLLEDDRLVGYNPPAPELFDRAWALMGVVFVIGGLVALALLLRAEIAA